MAAHRYWRINITARGGDGNIQIHELHFAKFGQAKHTVVTGAVQPGKHSSGTIAQTQDGLSGTSHLQLNNTALPQWVSFDFGAPVEVEVVRLYQANGTRYMTTADIQWSDDNVTFTTEFSIGGLSAGSRWAHRGNGALNKKAFWRWDPTAVNGGAYCRQSEIQLRKYSGGPDVTVPGLATAADWYDIYHPNNFIDNDDSTDFSQHINSSGVWFEIDPGQIVEYVLRAGNVNSDQLARTWNLYSSVDCVTWVLEHNVTLSPVWSLTESRTYTFLPDPPPIDSSPGYSTSIRMVCQRNRRIILPGLGF